MKIIGLLGNISHARRHLFSRELTRHIVEVCLHYFAPGRFFLSAEENRVMELTGVALVSNHSRMHNKAWNLKKDIFARVALWKAVYYIHQTCPDSYDTISAAPRGIVGYRIGGRLTFPIYTFWVVRHKSCCCCVTVRRLSSLSLPDDKWCALSRVEPHRVLAWMKSRQVCLAHGFRRRHKESSFIRHELMWSDALVQRGSNCDVWSALWWMLHVQC